MLGSEGGGGRQVGSEVYKCGTVDCIAGFQRAQIGIPCLVLGKRGCCTYLLLGLRSGQRTCHLCVPPVQTRSESNPKNNENLRYADIELGWGGGSDLGSKGLEIRWDL